MTTQQKPEKPSLTDLSRAQDTSILSDGRRRGKAYEAPPPGMMKPGRATSEKRRVMREWVADLVGRASHLSPRDIRDRLADYSGIWFGDVEFFTRTYVNPARERHGLEPARPEMVPPSVVLARPAPPPAAEEQTAPTAPPQGVALTPLPHGRVRLSVVYDLEAPEGIRLLSAIATVLEQNLNGNGTGHGH